MIVVKVLKNNSKFFKALSIGTGNEFACDVHINKKIIATLQPGEETVIKLEPGLYTVFFKGVRSFGLKSNQLHLNVMQNRDYIIQAKNGVGGLVASYALMTPQDYELYQCPHCGAPNRVAGIKFAKCEYCGSLLSK